MAFVLALTTTRRALTRPSTTTIAVTTARRAMSNASSTATPLLPALATPDAVAKLLTHADAAVRARICVLDTTWHMPHFKRDPLDEFHHGPRLPRAQFWDIDALAQHGTDLPHMLPITESDLAKLCAQLADPTRDGARGQPLVREGQHVVVYDRAVVPARTACRVWWTLRALGWPVDKVSVLDGGMDAWTKAGLPAEPEGTAPVPLAEADPEVVAVLKDMPVWQPTTVDADLIRDLDFMKTHLDTVQVVDARPPGRFAGRDPEPRPGLSSGHMKGALSIPAGAMLDPATGKFWPREKLAEIFATLRKDMDVVASCGSGVTAAVVAFGMHLVDPAKKVPIYDGSWTEWASRGMPIVKDDATE
ncbi:hypothetical protein AMAG_02629 [Allomyces macrogynus ATCC 38327]|uniref:Sulfurtransferase n=1 Tax=Allomyces macrogynus (strain ATCC 38327) TaxID=578462 RepID=A0A0L0S2Q5_ALLM3|nr:hypothetical protein AMAG_02629 [Allomyces macrogynus ATCC 38327]|eukprot:KNE56857.1 hypothetical protein AMAG_02629 [Allomyces macrogynus ATCC 38327]